MINLVARKELVVGVALLAAGTLLVGSCLSEAADKPDSPKPGKVEIKVVDMSKSRGKNAVFLLLQAEGVLTTELHADLPLTDAKLKDILAWDSGGSSETHHIDLAVTDATDTSLATLGKVLGRLTSLADPKKDTVITIHLKGVGGK